MSPASGRSTRWRGGVRPGNPPRCAKWRRWASSRPCGGGPRRSRSSHHCSEAGWDEQGFGSAAGAAVSPQTDRCTHGEENGRFHGNYSVVSIVTSDTRLARQIPRGMAMGLSESAWPQRRRMSAWSACNRRLRFLASTLAMLTALGQATEASAPPLRHHLMDGVLAVSATTS